MVAVVLALCNIRVFIVHPSAAYSWEMWLLWQEDKVIQSQITGRQRAAKETLDVLWLVAIDGLNI